MTACVNKKHSRRVAAAVSASLVGALTLGAAPAVVMAEEAGVEQQFITAGEAFDGATIQHITFTQGGVSATPTQGGDGTYHFGYKRNKAVELRALELKVESTTAHPDFTVDSTKEDSSYTIQYFNRDEKTGKETGSELTDDIIDAGKYVVKITANEGSDYEGGVVYIAFDIDPVDISGFRPTVVGPNAWVYDGTAKTIEFSFGDELYLNTDYTVQWYEGGHDLGDQWKVPEVKDAGSYRAVITGKGNYTGSIDLNDGVITVSPLDLSTVWFADVYSADENEPTKPSATFINGVLYGEDSAIVKELDAELNMTPGTVWSDNGSYTYTVVPGEGAKQSNFAVDSTGKVKAGKMNAHKVADVLDFQYDGKAWPGSLDYIKTDDKTALDHNLVTAVDDKGNEYSFKDSEIVCTNVFDASGNNVYNVTDWWKKPGTYTLVYRVDNDAMVNSKYGVGGQAFLTLNVYQDAINADAKASVAYDADHDQKDEIVTSISEVYSGRDISQDIKVTVKGANRDLVENDEFFVKYYDADGNQVHEVKNAGTYTMKVTAPTFKLSGTTEMTITISPAQIGTIDSKKLIPTTFGVAGAEYEYLPWREAGWAVVGEGDVQTLSLYYVDANGKEVGLISSGLINDVVKVVITNSEGEVVDKITDEGAYTLSFVARNDDAKNNYVMPADLVIECIKNGQNGSDVNHVKFVDVRYTDYFANAVAKVSDNHWMNGYKNTSVFGALDNLSRGQVATVLYNMAGGESLKFEGSYSDLWGYETGFSDVDGKAYYARAIAWAKQSGVVNGYADGSFHPDQPVTRQEFACMLANYAKKFDKSYEAPSADAMDEMSDAAQVADFAKTSVAWAVENGIIGNSGYVAPGANIIRADAACMVYNYAE